MENPTTVPEFISTLKVTRAEWDALLDSIDQVDKLKPGMAGDWSIKDIIAHVTWFEKEMVGLITAHALVGSELWNLPTDERNAAIYEEVKDQPLEQVLEESKQVHQQLLDVLPRLSDQDLTDPSGFPNMPPDWQPGMIIAQNTYEHYEDHMQDVEKWLAEKKTR